MLWARNLGKPAGVARPASRVLRGYAAVRPLPLSQLESSCPYSTTRGPRPLPWFPVADPSRRGRAQGREAGRAALGPRHRRPAPAPGKRPRPLPPGLARPCSAPAGLTLSARWWTRPRPGSASSCSSPRSGSSRRPAVSGRQRGPAGPTGAKAAIFVPASPAASSPAYFRG